MIINQIVAEFWPVAAPARTNWLGLWPLAGCSQPFEPAQHFVNLLLERGTEAELLVSIRGGGTDPLERAPLVPLHAFTLEVANAQIWSVGLPFSAPSCCLA